jgi:hypothetical protein
MAAKRVVEGAKAVVEASGVQNAGLLSEIAAMKSNWWRHIGFWAVYLLMMGYLSGRYDMRFGPAYVSELAQLPAKVALTYLVLGWLDRRPPWSPLRLGLALLPGLLGALLVNRCIMFFVLYPAFYAQHYSMTFWHLDRLLFTAIDIGTAVAAATAIRLSRTHQRARLREAQLQQEKLEAELKFLRAQINPHFLFNTLNNLYALARRESPRSAQLLLKLSQLMRFILYDCARPAIPIADELKVIRDLIELQELRYGDRLALTYEEVVDQPAFTIAPLLLLPLVENAFTHGAGENRFMTRMRIRVELEGGRLCAEVSNDAEDGEGVAGGGLGLPNLRRQLELLYPEKHELTLKREEGVFYARLVIFVQQSLPHA